jgi:hypothetical protein
MSLTPVYRLLTRHFCSLAVETYSSVQQLWICSQEVEISYQQMVQQYRLLQVSIDHHHIYSRSLVLLTQPVLTNHHAIILPVYI